MKMELESDELMSSHSHLVVEDGESPPDLKLHPLLVDTILRCIFNYEPLAVLKEIRQVCRKWKLICDPVFMKKSVFVFGDGEGNPKLKRLRKIPPEIVMNPGTFSALFSTIQQDISFTSFKFQYNLLTKSVREMYLEPNKRLMTQLTIHNPFSMDEEDSENCDIDNLVGPLVNKLILTASYRQKIQVKNFLSISADKLAPISHLDLYRCTIKLHSKKMAPKELKLSAFHVEQNERIAMFIPMSELVDFRRLDKLYLHGFTGCGLGSSYIRYSLNFSDCANVKHLTLIFIRINLDAKIAPEQLSLDRCVYFKDGLEIKQLIINEFLKSTHLGEIHLSGIFCSVKLQFEDDIAIDKLKITYSQIETSPGSRNRIKIKDLEIEEAQDFVLSILPQTIERLKITYTHPGSITCSNHDNLSNLKQLMLFESVSGLKHFANCRSLVDLILSPALRETVTVDDMPENIKRLFLLHNVYLEGEHVFQLDVLALSGCHSSFTKFDILQLFKKLQPATVVFCNYGHYNSTLNDICEKSVEIILNLKRILARNTVVAFGPVKWESEESFQNSSLAKIIDKKARYYQLNCLTAQVLDKTTFHNMIPFV